MEVVLVLSRSSCKQSLWLLVWILLLVPAWADDLELEGRLDQAARALMTAADSGGYGAAYKHMGSLFQKDVTQGRFSGLMEEAFGIRNPGLSYQLTDRAPINPRGQADERWYLLIYLVEVKAPQNLSYQRREMFALYRADDGTWQIVDWTMGPAEKSGTESHR